MTWQCEICCFAGHAAPVSESIEQFQQNILHTIHNFMNRKQTYTVAALLRTQGSSTVENVAVMTHLLHLCSLYLRYKRWSLCTSRCFKGSCVGEDWKKAPDSQQTVWEHFPFSPCSCFKGSAHCTPAENVPDVEKCKCQIKHSVQLLDSWDKRRKQA